VLIRPANGGFIVTVEDDTDVEGWVTLFDSGQLPFILGSEVTFVFHKHCISCLVNGEIWNVMSRKDIRNFLSFIFELNLLLS